MPELAAVSAPALAAPRRRAGAVVGSVGVALPPTVLANAPIAERLGVDEEWIVARTGVRSRRVAAAGETLVDYAAEAARRALAGAGLDPAEVDLVLVATMTHEQLSPTAAPLVATRIGAAGAAAIDVGAACSGFVSALALAAGQVEAGRARNVVVVGADLMSRLTDGADRATAALFGDGAGAVVVGGAERAAIGPSVLGSDGARGDLVAAGRAEGILRMKGHDTFRHAVDRLAEATRAAAAAAGRGLDEIDLFAYHQANGRILAAVAERLDLDRERVLDSIAEHANTSAATIPLALADAREAGRLRPGDSILLAAFGGGLTWAATVVEWESAGAGPAEEGR